MGSAALSGYVGAQPFWLYASPAFLIMWEPSLPDYVGAQLLEPEFP
jgi:hypothetical protein